MQRAYGVAVIPEVIKGAFIFGGRYGNGVLTVRDAPVRFSSPIFITLAGGSVGWQLGATSTDVVLVFVTQRSVEHFARGKFTLGADASVAAGPWAVRPKRPRVSMPRSTPIHARADCLRVSRSTAPCSPSINVPITPSTTAMR